jgi:hypothetical protein
MNKVNEFMTTELTHFFDDKKASFFGVFCGREDKDNEKFKSTIPGYRYFWDFDAKVSKLYGAMREVKDTLQKNVYYPFSLATK